MNLWFILRFGQSFIDSIFCYPTCAIRTTSLQLPSSFCSFNQFKKSFKPSFAPTEGTYSLVFTSKSLEIPSLFCLTVIFVAYFVTPQSIFPSGRIFLEKLEVLHFAPT